MGVDLSTHTGICVMGSGKKLLVASEYEFPGLSEHEREYALFNQVRNIWVKHSPDILLIETAITNAKFISAIQQNIASVVRFKLWEDNISYKDVSPSALKKFIAGKGNAKKELMMLELHVQWGIKTTTNNIADAVALALFGQCVLGDTDFKTPKKAVVKDFLKGLTPKT